ncbi:unnamed protein product [Diamesa serratosioi]
MFKILVLISCTVIYSIKSELLNAEIFDLNVETSEINLATAVVSILKNQLYFKHNTINVIEAFELDAESSELENCATKIIEQLNSKVAVCVEDFSTDYDILSIKRYISVFLIDYLESFQPLLGQITAENYNFDGYFMFVVANGNSSSIQSLFKTLWQVYIYNVIVLIEEDNQISLMSFIPYNKRVCGDTTPVIINKFNNGSLLFKTKELFPKKFVNLLNCPIKIASFSIPPAVLRLQHENGSFYYIGNDVELMNEMSRVMKFKKQYIFGLDRAGQGKVFDNGTSTGSINKVINGEVDLMMGNLFLTSSRMKFMTNTNSYSSMPMILIVPPGAPFTSFEKLFKPFQATVWYCLLGALGFGMFAIFIIKHQSEELQNLVLGKNVRYHYFNMLLIFVGGSQTNLPGRNFSRFLLMIFLLFCLVQRTLHQGSLYQFLKSENSAPPVQSINEMIEKEFEFFTFAAFEEFTHSSKIYERQTVYDFRNATYYDERIMDHEFKGALISTLSLTAYKNEVIKNNVTVRICKEYLMSLPQVIYFRKNHFLVESFNDNIAKLNAAGLIDYWTKKYIKLKYLYGIEPPREPKRLNISQLIGGFQICFAGLGIGLILFIREYFWK